MPTIPSGTKFMGVNPDVNTDEKRSSLSNSYQEFYTIDDIVAEASAADTNIYNSDGTLDANRTVDLDGNTLNLSGGNVGINQPTPTVPLHIKGTAIPSVNESLARFEVSDATGAYLSLDNASLVNGEFVPQVIGRQNSGSTQSALYVSAAIDATQDTGTNPVTVFRSALASLTQVATRPLFAFRNWTTTVMTILADGKVGIGTTTPSTSLHVRSTAVPSTGEPVARFDVSDGAGYLQIANATSTDGTFAPIVQGRQSGISTQPAFQTEGIIDSADDTGTTPVTAFKARLNTLAAVVTRPVFQFSNWSTSILTMLANGNVGIGTTTPTEKLEVSGKTKTTTFQMTTTPTAGYVLTSDASGNGTWAAAAGGLTEFTELETTAAPNATVPVNSLTPVTATTNADFAIKPKGNGAFILAVPDNTTTGGNKRGQYAVDLQFYRTAASQVASGNYTFVVGTGATASAQSAVAIGGDAIASGTNSLAMAQGSASGTQALSIGVGGLASGNGAFALGGYSSANSTASGTVSLAGQGATASASFAFATGYLCIANGNHSVALGRESHTFGVWGRQAYASGIEGTTGDAQASKFILRERTTGNTATTLTSDSGAASTANQVILSNQSAYRFKGSIIGKQSGSTNAAVWDIDGFIVRGANAAATTLNVSNVTLVQNTPAWGTPTLAADTTNGGLQVQVTGAAATNIQWTAVIDTTEVIYA